MTTNEDNTIKDGPKRSTTIAMISIFYLLVGLPTLFVITFSVARRLFGHAIPVVQDPLAHLLLLISGMIAAAIGIGLWKLKRWAYKSAIVISGLSFLIGVFTLSFIPIIFHGLILIGLFSKGAKAIFISS